MLTSSPLRTCPLHLQTPGSLRLRGTWSEFKSANSGRVETTPSPPSSPPSGAIAHVLRSAAGVHRASGSTSWTPGSPSVTSVAPTEAGRRAAAELMADEDPCADVTGTANVVAEAVAASSHGPSGLAKSALSAAVASRLAASKVAPLPSSPVTVHVPTAADIAVAGVDAALGKSELGAACGALARPLGPEDFELLCVVGRGAFGKVFQVRKRDTGEVFAMKVMRKDRIRAKDHHEYVRAERDVLTSIVHPYVVTLRYSFQTPSRLYLVLDFVNGGHLFFQLFRAGTFDERRARLYTAEIVLAVSHLHSLGIVHRDLKPENVLLDAEGHVRVTDFGLAKAGTWDDPNQRSNSFIGTLEYMAPEIIAASGHGKEVDWWSVGILLYEMLTGVAPFRAKGKNQLQKLIMAAKLKIPPYLSSPAASLIRSLLAKDPAKRLGHGPSGSDDIKRHPFFKEINWAKLERREISAPFDPSVSGVESVENFDKIWTDLPPQDSPGGTPRDDAPIGDADKLFEGFTYVAPPTMFDAMANLKLAKK